MGVGGRAGAGAGGQAGAGGRGRADGRGQAGGRGRADGRGQAGGRARLSKPGDEVVGHGVELLVGHRSERVDDEERRSGVLAERALRLRPERPIRVAPSCNVGKLFDTSIEHRSAGGALGRS